MSKPADPPPPSVDPPTLPAPHFDPPSDNAGDADGDERAGAGRKRSRRTLKIPDDAVPNATPQPAPVDGGATAAADPAPAALPAPPVEDAVIRPMRIISIASDLPAMEIPPEIPAAAPPAGEPTPFASVLGSPPPPAPADDDDDDPLAKTIERAPRDAARTVKIERVEGPARPADLASPPPPVAAGAGLAPQTQPEAPDAKAAVGSGESGESVPTLVQARSDLRRDLDWAEELEEVEPERISLPNAPPHAPPPPPPRSTPLPARAPPAAAPPAVDDEREVVVDTDELDAPKKPPPPPPSRKPVAAAPSAPETLSAPRIKPWWEELFSDDYIRTLDEPEQHVVDHDVDFIEQSLGVEAGGVILDLASGDGRHAIELSRRGYSVVGYDLSLAMLARAAENAQARGQKLNFLQGDMQEMGFEDMFDGVYCWQTSFGYFEEEKNVEVLRRMHRALKSGGVLLLDMVNRDYVAPRQPSMVWYEGDGCVCMDEMKVDFLSSRLRVKRTVMFDDGRSREVDYSIRLYSLHELGRLLHEVGFRVIEVTGHTAHRGVFFGSESPRLIVLAERD